MYVTHTRVYIHVVDSIQVTHLKEDLLNQPCISRNLAPCVCVFFNFLYGETYRKYMYVESYLTSRNWPCAEKKYINSCTVCYKSSFLHSNAFVPLLNIIDYVRVGFFLDSPQFHWYIFIYLSRHHTILIIVSL